MSKIGGLYWLFFVVAIILFVLMDDSYLLMGLLVVMTGLVKLDHDWHTKRTVNQAVPADAQEQLSRLQAGADAALESHKLEEMTQREQLAKKMIALENSITDLKALVTEKYAARSGKKTKKPADE